MHLTRSTLTLAFVIGILVGGAISAIPTEAQPAAEERPWRDGIWEPKLPNGATTHFLQGTTCYAIAVKDGTMAGTKITTACW